MNSIVKTLAMMGLMGASVAAFAQRGPPPSVDQQVERMTKHLGLTAEQQTSVRALLIANAPSEAEMAQRRAAMDAGLKAILTEDQYVELSAARMNRESGRQGRQRGPGHKASGGSQ